MQMLIIALTGMYILNCCVIEYWPIPFAPKVLWYWGTAPALFCMLSLCKIYLQWLLLLVDSGDLTVELLAGRKRCNGSTMLMVMHV